MPRPAHALPEGLVPRLLSRKQAAAYCGMGVTSFNEVVRAKGLRDGIVLPGRKEPVWDRRGLDADLDKMAGLETGEVSDRETRKIKWREGRPKGAGGRHRPGISVLTNN